MKTIYRSLIHGLLIWFCLSLTPSLVTAEQIPQVQVHLSASMTLQQAATSNGATLGQLTKILEVPETTKPDTQLAVLLKGQPLSVIEGELQKAIVEQKLEDNKNWPVIMTKLALWLLIIIGSGFLLRKNLLSPKVKLLFAGAVVLVIGFLLGSDPNPLGMIKDAAYIYGTTGVIFKPRIIVAVALLITILLGGRLFCGWACHLGALQELVYAIPSRKLKLPFGLTNLIRFLAFLAILVAGIGYGLDLFGPIDPYQIFNFNTSLTVLGITAALVVLGIFLYRPWCTLLCPFGFLAWLADKASFLRIVYRPELCQHCQLCEKSCPTGRVTGTLVGKSSGECYSCGRCLQACPQKALDYGKK